MFTGRIRRGLLAFALVAANTAAMNAMRPRPHTDAAPSQRSEEVVGAGWKEDLLCLACVGAGVAVIYAGVTGYALVIANSTAIGAGVGACILICGIAYGDLAS